MEEKRVLWPFGGVLGLLEAFQMVLWVFDGNMVGKWTNEPCNGVGEVVNPFWVLTVVTVKMPPSSFKKLLVKKLLLEI